MTTTAPSPPATSSATPKATTSPGGRKAARRELAVALFDIAQLPLRLFGYWVERPVREQRMREDLRAFAPRPVPTTTSPGVCPERPLRIVLSCAETSGEIHASNLARELRARCAEWGWPAPELIGLGGEKLAEAGVDVAIDTLSKANMGISAVAGALPYYIDLVARAHDLLVEGGADLFLPVDSPALHVPLGRIARRAGVPVVHFVTPQYWGWAPWRVERYRSAINLALSILPFEPAWFERHGVRSRYVGHPLQDALRGVLSTTPDPDSRRLVLLPGSRASVIGRNLPWMLELIEGMNAKLGGYEVVVLQDSERHRGAIERHLADYRGGVPVRLEVGELHEQLAGARAALSVSGTILIDLLHHRLPSVVLYRLGGALESWMSRHLLTPPYFASPNLLAGEEVLPEFCFTGRGPVEDIEAALVRCLGDDDWRRGCMQGLERAAGRLGGPGAVERAASLALSQWAEICEQEGE